MRAGELRQRIVIEANTPTRNSVAEEVPHWATFATVWAKVETISGAESIEQQQASASLLHHFTIRNYAGIQPAMRVRWRDRIFDISAVLDDNLNRQMLLVCSEVVDESD